MSIAVTFTKNGIDLETEIFNIGDAVIINGKVKVLIISGDDIQYLKENFSSLPIPTKRSVLIYRNDLAEFIVDNWNL